MSNIIKTNDPNWALKQEQNGARVVVPTNPEQFNAYQANRRAIKKQKDTTEQLGKKVDQMSEKLSELSSVEKNMNKMSKDLDELKKTLHQLLTATKQPLRK